MERKRRLTGLDFDQLLLAGVILLMLTATFLIGAFYVVPSEHLAIPELQPAIRVAREADFPVGTSRVRNWGRHTILIVRPDSLRYFALEGTSPADGCILRFDPESLRVFSPCRYVVYDLRGDVVVGLSTQALQRYSVSVRDGVVYVSEG